MQKKLTNLFSIKLKCTAVLVCHFSEFSNTDLHSIYHSLTFGKVTEQQREKKRSDS